jgi:hypothetical protein
VDVLGRALARADSDESLLIAIQREIHQAFGDSTLFPGASPLPSRNRPVIDIFGDDQVIHTVWVDFTFSRWRQRVQREVIDPFVTSLSPTEARTLLSTSVTDDFTASIAYIICVQEDLWTRLLLRRFRRELPLKLYNWFARMDPGKGLLLPLELIAARFPKRYTVEMLYARFEPLAVRALSRARDLLAARLDADRESYRQLHSDTRLTLAKRIVRLEPYRKEAATGRPRFRSKSPTESADSSAQVSPSSSTTSPGSVQSRRPRTSVRTNTERSKKDRRPRSR